MAKIVLFSLVFPPDGVATARIMGDLASNLEKLGHDISVITTSPHYNRDLEAEARQPLKAYLGSIVRQSNYSRIPVYHVMMPKKSASILKRVLPWLNFQIISTIFGFHVLSKPDIFIVVSPLLTIGISAWILCLWFKSKYIYSALELHPDLAISMGMITNKIAIRVLNNLADFVYLKAASVVSVAQHTSLQLRCRGVDSGKIKTIPNCTDISELRPLPKVNDFSRKYDIWSRFVVSYAGNIGPSQDLDTFVTCSNLLRYCQNIHFMLVGDGMSRVKIEQHIRNLNLPNFTLLGYLPYSLMAQLYAASDLCLVPQSREISGVAIPSKAYNIMACARPVLAVTGLGTDLAELVTSVGCGIVVEPGSPEQLAQAILSAFNEPERLSIMGEAGRAHVEEYYSPQSIAKQYDSLIRSIMNDSEV